MAEVLYYKTASSNITGNDDILPCMTGHHRVWDKLRRNIADDERIVKCRCEDPVTEHAGTYLAGVTGQNKTDLAIDEDAAWTPPEE